MSKGDLFPEIMRGFAVLGVVLATLMILIGQYEILFGEQFRVSAGTASSACGMGVFVGSVLGHGWQLQTENKNPQP